MNTRNSLILSILLALVVIVGVWWGITSYSKPGTFTKSPIVGETKTVEGRVLSTLRVPRTLTVRTSQGDEWDIAEGTETIVKNKRGEVITLSDIRRNFLVEISGEVAKDKTLTAKTITLKEEPNITVWRPESNQEIGNPVVIEGEGRVF